MHSSALKELARRLLRTGMTAEQAARLMSRAVVELVPNAAKPGAERTRAWRERKRRATVEHAAALRGRQ